MEILEGFFGKMSMEFLGEFRDEFLTEYPRILGGISNRWLEKNLEKSLQKY